MNSPLTPSEVSLVRTVYANLPTHVLIGESRVLTIPDLPEAARKRVEQLAINGTIAFSKVDSYRQVMIELNEQRKTSGLKIGQLLNSTPASPGFFAEMMRERSFEESGLQEVYIHLMVNCVARIRVLLDLSREGAGLKKLSPTQDTLYPFKVLRDHFEHLEDRLVGHSEESRFMHSERTDEEFVFGFETDSQNNIVIENVTVPVTDEGIEMVIRTIDEHETAIRAKCLTIVTNVALMAPHRIPDLKQIGKQMGRNVLSPKAE